MASESDPQPTASEETGEAESMPAAASSRHASGHVPMALQLPSAVNDEPVSVEQQLAAHVEGTEYEDGDDRVMTPSPPSVRSVTRSPSNFIIPPPSVGEARIESDEDMPARISENGRSATDEALRIDRLVTNTIVPTENTLFADPMSRRVESVRSLPRPGDTLVTTVSREDGDHASSISGNGQFKQVAAQQYGNTSEMSARVSTAKNIELAFNRSQSQLPHVGEGEYKVEQIYMAKSAGNGGSGSSTPRRNSLSRLLNPLQSVANRIHPIMTYTPSAAGIANYDSDEGESPNTRIQGVARDEPAKGSARRNSVGRSSAGRASDGRVSAGRSNGGQLTTQVVQVAGATSPTAKKLTQRYIYEKTQASLAEMFDKPAQSRNGRLVVRIVFVCIIVNIGVIAMETCDGKNHGSSAPGYPYLPDDSVYKALDAFFTMIFTIEFIGRIVSQKRKRAILKDTVTWVDLISLSPWYLQLIASSAGHDFDVDDFNGLAHTIGLLRLLRITRLGYILQHFESMRILVASVKASIPPLLITMFFLFTLVMLLATAIFYAEPCYNLYTCPFTDIFNSAYFIMVTVATVGYGNQIPSTKNFLAMGIAFVAMVFGQLYLAMPLAIVGNNFQDTYEDFQNTRRRRLRRHDTTLNPFDSVKLNRKSQRLCEIQFHLLHAWRVVQLNLDKLFKKRGEAKQLSGSSTLSATTKVLAGNIHAFETELQTQQQHHLKLKEAIEKLLDVHAEACKLLQAFVPHKRNLHVGDANTITANDSVLSQVWKAIAKSRFGSRDHHKEDPRTLSHSHKGRLWLALEVPDSSVLATVINRVMVGFALLSVWIFFSESLPELMNNGIETSSCRRVVEDYCDRKGFASFDPGCFQRFANSSTDWNVRLDFTCSKATDHASCYGNGFNFGSLEEDVLSCDDAFTTDGVSVICYRMQCLSSAAIVNMEPYWIYFEWCFGLSFLSEMLLRFYACSERLRFFNDMYNVFDVLAVLPFGFELCDYVFRGVKPSYAIVATSPSFLSVIRVLKTMRILKLTRHFRGTKVLVQTAKETYKQLLIPIFFLLTMCILAAAVLFEVERGTECFVGESCMWWNKELLTPEMVEGLPLGKRVLVQDRRRAIITDMIKSTWLSAATFTTVGYGDVRPRTPMGRMLTMCIAVVGTIYTSMPITLVGGKFRSLYARHVQKIHIRRAGSSTSWKTKRNLLSSSSKKAVEDEDEPLEPAKGHSSLDELARMFKLDEGELELLHQFTSMKRTLQNLLRNMENLYEVNKEVLHRIHPQRLSIQPIGSDAPITTVGNNMTRKAGSMEHAIEEKSQAILDTLLQFSRLVEKLQDAPPYFEAFLPEKVTDPNGVEKLLPDALKNRLIHTHDQP